MGTVNSSVSSSSTTILSNATPISVTNTIFLSTSPTTIVAGVHTAEVISTWDPVSPAERSSMTVIVPTEAEHTELQNGIISRRDEAEADYQRVSASTQDTSLPISLTKRDRLKDKPNDESPAVQRAGQHLKGVTPPHISLTGRRHVKEIPHPGQRQHHIYHMIPVSDPPEYVEEDTSHSTRQLTRKHHLNTFPAPVSTAQQASLETDSSFDDDVDVPPEADSIELKRRSTPPDEPPDANPSQESTAPQNAASMPGTANLPPASSETTPHITAEQVMQSQDEIPALHKPAHRVQPQRNSAVPLEIPLAPKRNSAVPLDKLTPPKRSSAVPQDRPSTSVRKKRDLAPAQQVLAPPTFQQPPLTKQSRRQNPPKVDEGASWTVAHPPPKETERSRWTVSNPPPGGREGGRYSVANPPTRNGRERMRLSHYPMRKIQLFGRRRGGGNSTESGGKEAD
jgi:hypothetical protein